MQTLGEQIDEQALELVNKIDVGRPYTEREYQWLHFVKTLSTWCYIAKYRREHPQMGKAA